MTFTDQPISKEERAENVLKRCRYQLLHIWRSNHGFSTRCDTCREVGDLLTELDALDRARTPPKPKTLEERMRGAAYSTDSMRIYVPIGDASSIARDYALEKMRECHEICVDSGAHYSSDAIAKLIEEERRSD